MRSLIFGNLLIAAAAGLITHETYYLLGVQPRWDALLVLVVSATFFVYSVDRLSEASKENVVEATERHRWIERNRPFLWAGAVVSATAGTVAALFVPSRVLLGLIPLGAAALAYSLPLLWGPSGPYRLKDVAGLKIFVITAVWAGATALLPALQTDLSPESPAVLLTVAERAVFIFALTLPFDIRDMERDRASEIWTIPLAIGPKATRYLALACIVLFAAIVLAHRQLAAGSTSIPLLVSAAVTCLLLTRASRDRSELYFVGALDGMILLQWALVASWFAV